MFKVRMIISLVILFFLFLLSGCGQVATPSVYQKSIPMVSPTVKTPPDPNQTPTLGPTPISTPVSVSIPVHLSIPSIGINALVEPVDILDDGNLGTPSQNPWTGVGWYSLGPRPGEVGSAIIDGHLDRPGGAPAIFWNLRDIHVGDDVMVVDAHDKTVHFHVTRIAYYTPQEAPIQEIFGSGGGTYLNLITCAGDWIPSQHQTTLRLVVYTSLSV